MEQEEDEDEENEELKQKNTYDLKVITKHLEELEHEEELE